MRDGQVAPLIGKFMLTALNILRAAGVGRRKRIRRNMVAVKHVNGRYLASTIIPARLTSSAWSSQRNHCEAR